MADFSMTPEPGGHRVHYMGDRIRFVLKAPPYAKEGWRGLLRTNLTRGAKAREEVVALSGAHPSEGHTFAGASWRDIPLHPTPGGWTLELPLAEVGYFRAKAYAVDPFGNQYWPEGPDVGISVLPDHLRTANAIYCAFPRMFMPPVATPPQLLEGIRKLDEGGYTVIPPSGTLRSLTRCIPHIVETLGCRILHLLPLGPVPTTYARMGRYGSPYAQLDLTAIDPALVEFDRRSTAEDQFRELAYAAHLRGAQVFLDIVINHTGWGSRLMGERPEWFERNPDGSFHSPGAWGTVWEDLVELDNHRPGLWEHIADALLVWCRRGVDGFRCDAGYMVPLPTWQYIIARVRQEFPDCTFLLEGLGGAWEATETLLAEGGMQWAYSELFQNYAPTEVAGYLDHCIRQGERLGPLVHYSETHDNLRLAARGRDWSLLRNRLSALTSLSGAFGFTAGVEWLAREKVDVHGAPDLAWDASPNLIPELSRLNRLLAEHPCFFDGARLERLSPEDSPVLALGRSSQDGQDRCLVLINLDPEQAATLVLPTSLWRAWGDPRVDLLGQAAPEIRPLGESLVLTLAPAGAHCLSDLPGPRGLSGDRYRARRAQAAWAYQQLTQVWPAEDLGPASWQELGEWVAQDPRGFLGALANLKPDDARQDLMTSLVEARSRGGYAPVIPWELASISRITPVPPGHWLLVRDSVPFAAALHREGRRAIQLRSVPVEGGQVVAFPPGTLACPPGLSGEAELLLERFTEEGRQARGGLRLCPEVPHFAGGAPRSLALLTNGRGAMARLHANLGEITSKYDCLLGANLHPDTPCDRHVLAKRLRAWVNADGFITSLDHANLHSFDPGPPARWVFLAHAGDGRVAEIHLCADLLQGRNTFALHLSRRDVASSLGEPLPGHCKVTLILRVDLEDRDFHGETHGSREAETFFDEATSRYEDGRGFLFRPTADRHLEVRCEAGRFHDAPEWCWNIPHPVEATRGMNASGDAWSPGWFEIPLPRSGSAILTADAEGTPIESQELQHLPLIPSRTLALDLRSGLPQEDSFGHQLLRASSAFLARRGQGTTIIAGYPWFLDWGRDSLIAARGLLAAGFHREVRELLLTYATLEAGGTLPNMLSADSTANRDTSDAPLWFGLACEEAAAVLGPGLYGTDVGGRTLAQVLASIGSGYLRGTPNGIRVDGRSGLVWSPSHFTWMDTNYPAGTPREGNPIELQALWIRLLEQLSALEAPGADWLAEARKTLGSLDRFWDPVLGCFADLLDSEGRPDGLIRPNQLFLVSLGIVGGLRARGAVSACARHLLVPGGMRSLAPLPAPLGLPILSSDGSLLNDPGQPYWGHYEGDEDSRRKPAYHNGTAWVWPLGTFCEALARAWDFAPPAVAAARAYLGACDRLLLEGCSGHLPEILDGDAPHTQRGCDAQAWSTTEVLRVWQLLARD
nr:amylo-alpha-1,6-glucosidase [uncultured Holophaga sp.]